LVFLLLLLFVVVFGVLSKKFKTPYPIVIVVGALLSSLVPHIPNAQLNPDLVFFVILPPLLYSAAWLTSWREFSYNLVSILFLAFGLVTFTVLGVTALGNFVLPGFDWRVGLVLGAVVAPTDAIAAVSIALSFLTPYLAYLTADAVKSSGVLAVVASGLYLSRQSAHFFSPGVRLQAWAVWESLTFILNGLVFVLIGLQLHFVLSNIRDHQLGTLIEYGALFSAFLILVRLTWNFPGAYLANLIRTRILHQRDPMPGVRQIFVVGWTGMRGVS